MWACVCSCASGSFCGDAWSDAAWTYSDWPPTFLQCYVAAVWERLNVELGPRAPVLVFFCFPHCYWTEHSRTLHLCSGIRDSEQLPLESCISYKQVFLLDSRGRCLRWINQGFTVTGSQRFCGYNHYWQQQPELTAWSWPLTSSPFSVATPVNYCTPRRAMNVPILISLHFRLFINLFSLSAKWPNLLWNFILFFLQCLSSYIENCYNSNGCCCFLSVFWGMSCRLMTLKMFNYLFYIY